MGMLFFNGSGDKKQAEQTPSPEPLRQAQAEPPVGHSLLCVPSLGHRPSLLITGPQSALTALEEVSRLLFLPPPPGVGGYRPGLAHGFQPSSSAPPACPDSSVYPGAVELQGLACLLGLLTPWLNEACPSGGTRVSTNRMPRAQPCPAPTDWQSPQGRKPGF